MSIINTKSCLPLNRQVENYLRQLIAQEKYQKGELLPTEMELTKELGVARNTVRTAMDKLVREGVVSRKKGVGTQVNRAPVVTNLSKWRSFATELGDRIHTEKREVCKAIVEGEIARDLDALDGQEVVCLKRLKAAEDEPVALLVSYFPRELNIGDGETFEGKLYEVLAEKYRVVPARSCEEIGAMMAGGEVASALEVGKDVPVLYRKRRVLDAYGAMVELAFAYYRADRFVYEIELPWEEE